MKSKKKKLIALALAGVMIALLIPLISFGGSSVNANFDYDKDTLFTIVNGYGSGYTLNYGENSEKLTNNGDIFYIAVTNTLSGKEYPSFCAHAGSKSFAGDPSNPLDCNGYVIAGGSFSELSIEGKNYNRFFGALNYIEDNYGGLNSKRAVTQTVIWALLGTIDIDDPLFEATVLSDEEKDVVRNALKNADTYKGSGKVVDIVYMVCEKHANDFVHCQPQLVPIYSKENLKDFAIVKGSVELTKSDVESNELIDGAAFSLTDSEGAAVTKDTLGGKAQWSDLEFGEYTIDEITAAEGYDLDSFVLYIIDDNGNRVELTDKKIVIGEENPSIELEATNAKEEVLGDTEDTNNEEEVIPADEEVILNETIDEESGAVFGETAVDDPLDNSQVLGEEGFDPIKDKVLGEEAKTNDSVNMIIMAIILSLAVVLGIVAYIILQKSN